MYLGQKGQLLSSRLLKMDDITEQITIQYIHNHRRELMHKRLHVGFQLQNRHKMLSPPKQHVTDDQDLHSNQKYDQNYIRFLETKLNTLQTNNLHLQQFYQQKITYLKFILMQQKDKKNNLLKEITQLRQQAQQQHQYLNHVKNHILISNRNPPSRSVKIVPLESNFNSNRQKKHTENPSKNKAILFGCSGKLRYSQSKVKKCKSEQLIESQRAINTTNKTTELLQNLPTVKCGL